jgi:hypothetical protein
MKRYIKLSIITILFILEASSSSHASQQEYFRNVFDSVDIEADYLLSNGDIIQKTKDAKVLITIPSDLQSAATIDTTQYEKLIVLCVDDINSQDSCYKDFSSQGVGFEPFQFNSLILQIGVFKNMRSVLIDEGYLFSHKYMEVIAQFLEQFASQEPVKVESKRVGFSRDSQPSDFLLDTFLTSLLILIAAFYVYGRTKFQKAKFSSSLRYMVLFAQKYGQVIKLLLIVLAVVSMLALVFFLILISYRDLKDLSVIYMYDYAKGVSALQNFKIFAAHGSYVKIVLQFLYILSMVSFFTFLVLDAGQELKSSVLRVVHTGLDITNYWLLMLGHLVLIILFSGLPSPFMRVLLIFTLISLIFLLVIGYIYSIDIKKVLSIKMTLFSFLCVFAALIVGILLTTTRHTSSKRLVSNEALINGKDYLLPVSIGQGHVFNEEVGIFKSNGTLLIDNLLVHHPDYKVINNLPFKDFSGSQTTPFIVFASDKSEYLKELNELKSIPAYFLSDVRTSYFSLKTEEIEKQEVRGVFTVSCSNRSTKSAYFTIKYYMKNNQIDKRLVTFPGCRSRAVEKFSVPIELPKTDAVYNIDFGKARVLDYSFYKNGVLLKPVYYKDLLKDKLLYEVAGDFEVLSAYSIGLTQSIKVERGSDTIDLNQLVALASSTKTNSDPFLLWSFEEMTLLKFITND